MSDLSPLARSYVVALTTSMVGVMVALLVLAPAPDHATLTAAAVAAILMTMAWLYPLPLAFKRRLFLDTSVLIAAIVLLPTGLAMLAVGAGTLLGQRVRRQEWVQATFNGAQTMAQAAVGGSILSAVDDRTPHRPEVVGYVLLAGLAIFVVNHLIVVTMIGMQTGRSPVAGWRQAADGSGMELVGHLSQVAIGALAVFLLETIPWALPLLILPPIALYRALRGWIRSRQEAAAQRHRADAGPVQAQRVALLGTWDWNLRTGDSVWSEETRHILGLPGDAVAASYEALLGAVHPEDRESFNRAVHDALRTGEAFQVEHRVVLPDGAERFVKQRGEVVPDAADGGRLAATVQDVTERKTLEAQLARQAIHDPLTGLPNRALVLDHLATLLASRRPDLGQVAVVAIEVEQGGAVSGAGPGRDILLEAARRLRASVHDGEMLARYSASRFMVVLQVQTADAATERAADIRHALDPAGAGVDLGVTVGAAVSGTSLALPEELVRAVEADLDRARSKPRAGPAATADWSSALVSATQLRDALVRGELSLYYQPEVSLATGDIVGFEAVLRWRHPTGVWLLPEDFLPVAETSGLTVPVGRWVLEEACRAARAWPAPTARAEPLTVSVNIEREQFYHPDFATDVAGTLVATGLSGEALRLEVTEPTVVQDADASQRTMEALRQHGVRVTIDDFGAGYASLGFLQRLPVDRLKIGRALIAPLESGEADRAIVQAIVSLAHTLGMRADATGIETPMQLAWADALGCERGEGYFFSAPLDGEQLAELFAGAARSGELSLAGILTGEAISAARSARVALPDDRAAASARTLGPS